MSESTPTHTSTLTPTGTGSGSSGSGLGTGEEQNLRKSKRKRVPTKHLIYGDDGKGSDSESRKKSQKKVKRTGAPASHTCDDASTSAFKTTIKINESESLTKINILVKKTYDKMRRNHAVLQKSQIKTLWGDNLQKLGENLHEQSHKRSSQLSNRVINPGEISQAFQSATEHTTTGGGITTTLKIYQNQKTPIKTSSTPDPDVKLFPLSNLRKCKSNPKISKPKSKSKTKYKLPRPPLKVEVETCTKVKSPVIILPTLSKIPPVLAWTSIPFNVYEDDGKFLTNIPFLGDEIIDKDKKFIDDMMNLYQGKIHGVPDEREKSNSKRMRMDDDVFYDLVGALVELEKGSPGVFTNVDANENDNSVVQEPMPVKVEVVDDEVKVETGVEVETEEQESQSKKILVDPVVPDPDPASAPKPPLHEESPNSNSVISSMTVSTTATATTTTVETNSPSPELFAGVASTFKGIGNADELRERYESIKLKKSQPEKPPLPILSSGVPQQDPSSYFIPNIEGAFAKDLPKEFTMHAYNFLFCRRCFQYDCAKGHNGDDHVDLKHYKQKRNPQLFNMNYVCEIENCYLKLEALGQDPLVVRTKEEIMTEWSPGDESMFRCLIDSFPNPCYVAKLMMNKTCQQVNEYANLEDDPKGDPDSNDTTLTPIDLLAPSTSLLGSDIGIGSNLPTCASKKRSKPLTKKSSSVSKKNLARRWINNVKRSEKSDSSGGIKMAGVLPPRFMPCQHDSSVECDDKNPNCYCGHNGTSCEKFCTCPPTCKRRFPGCRCNSTCDSKRCVCFFAARECDPDLCTGCGAHEHKSENITCRNVNIQKRLHKHLLMGKSDVAGWGIFIKEDAQRGDFIAEYRGEIISHDESERRGHVYDKIQHTFLFELNDHFVVDATRKGNKSRFVNSSKNPNCEVKRMLVNGDHRIGIYAKRYIDAGEELFYDYEDVLEKQQKVAAASAALKAASTIPFPSTSQNTNI